MKQETLLDFADAMYELGRNDTPIARLKATQIYRKATEEGWDTELLNCISYSADVILSGGGVMMPTKGVNP